MRRRHWPFPVVVIGIGIAALAFRVAYVLVFAPHRLPVSDGLFYHQQAINLAQGRGFIDPFVYLFSLHRRASAGHPPLFSIVLAGVSLFSGKSLLAHQLTESFLEAGAVVAIGWLGWEVAGERVGIIAALIAAVYPSLWAGEGFVLSESLYGLLVALMLLCAYRFWHRPGVLSAATLGLAVGLATLCRSEALLYLPLLVVPVILVRTAPTFRERLVQFGIGVCAAVLVLTPWTVRNLLTFKEPVLTSTNASSVIAGANCREAYYGSRTGAWAIECARVSGHGDESQLWNAAARRGINYARAHLGRLPIVLVYRVARTWQVYPSVFSLHQSQREWLEFIGFFVIVPFAVAGAFVLRRRAIPIFPLLVPIVAVTLGVALTSGGPRFRLAVDIAFIVLAAAACDAMLNRLAAGQEGGVHEVASTGASSCLGTSRPVTR